MNAPSTSEPENQLWGIYFRDREYARLLGDPLRMVIEAPTEATAERLEAKTIEQTTSIQSVIATLQTWHNELSQKSRRTISHRG